MRRRLEDEVSKLDMQSSYLEVDKSVANHELGVAPGWLGINNESEVEQRPVSALLMRP